MVYLVLDPSLFRQPFCVFIAVFDHEPLNTGARRLHAGSTFGSSSYGVQPSSPFIVLAEVVGILLFEFALLFLASLFPRGVAPVIDHRMVTADQPCKLAIGPAIRPQSPDRLLGLFGVALSHTSAYHKKGPLRAPSDSV